MKTQIEPPFPQHHQLNSDLDNIGAFSSAWNNVRLPGQPRIWLSDQASLWKYLEEEFYSAQLEKMAPHLWLMSTQSSANISPLHRQRVKRRSIVITEGPRLHLFWHDDRIFIKPLPPCLLSHAFWTIFLLAPSPVSSSHNSPPQPRADDFGKLGSNNDGDEEHQNQRTARAALARPIAQLLPTILTSYTAFCDLSSHLALIPDSSVSPRYAYGELRLAPLNFHAKLFLRRFYFFRMHPQYGTYFVQFYGPVLFVFGVLSVALGAMQVEMATEALFGDRDAAAATSWVGFWHVCRWFSVLSLVLVALVACALLALLLWRLWAEWSFALRDRWRKNREKRRERLAAGV